MSSTETLTYGGSLAFLGGGIAGFEVDFGYSPNFFGSDSNDALNLVGDGNVTTLMANLMLAGPKAAVRPYVVGRRGVDQDASRQRRSVLRPTSTTTTSASTSAAA